MVERTGRRRRAMTSAARPDVLAAAADAGAIARVGADTAEDERRLPDATVKALVEAGMMRLLVPSQYDGPGVDPMTFVAAVERIARDDGAAGWCTAIASSTSSMSLFLPEASARMIFGPHDLVTGGVFAPNGSGIVGDGGVRATGRWQWGSGTQHCDWIVGGVRCDDDTFRLCWFPQDDVTFHDTWHTSGLRGTGSLDFSVEDAFVPDELTTQPGVTRPVVDVALASFPMFALLGIGIAATALGVARRALDELVELAGAKRPQYASRSLAEQPYTHIELSRAEARVRSARSFLYDELSAAWEVADDGEPISVEGRVAIRLAALHATESAVAAVDAAYTLAGGSSVFSSNVLQRCLRDVHMATQHVMVAPKLHATLGRSLVGLDIDTSML